MTWADIIIILVATVLGMAMKRMDQQITYDCPHYCSVDHMHYCPATLGAGLDYSSGFLEDCVDRPQ